MLRIAPILAHNEPGILPRAPGFSHDRVATAMSEDQFRAILLHLRILIILALVIGMAVAALLWETYVSVGG